MVDDIFWGNLLGLLKRGKWTLSLEEASALVQIYQEAVKKSQPPTLPKDANPIIKKDKKPKVKL